MGLAVTLLIFLGATLPVMLVVFIPLQFLIDRDMPGWGLAFVLGLAVLFLVDLNFNWDGIAYPSLWLNFFLKPWVAAPVLFVAFVYAARRLANSRELGDVDPR